MGNLIEIVVSVVSSQGKSSTWGNVQATFDHIGIGKTFTSCRCRSTAVKTTVKTLGVEPIIIINDSNNNYMRYLMIIMLIMTVIIIVRRRRISIIIAIPSTIQIFQILASLYAAKAVLTLTPSLMSCGLIRWLNRPMPGAEPK